MNAISPILQGSSTMMTTVFVETSIIVKKIYDITIRMFPLLQNIGFISYGIEEFSLGFLSTKLKQLFGKAKKTSSKLEQIAGKSLVHLRKLKKIRVEQALVLGLVYVGSGVFSGMAALQRMQKLNLGPFYSAFHYTGWNLFLFGNFYALHKQIQSLHHAYQLAKSGKPELVKLSSQIIASSILGMISALGYIILSLYTQFAPDLNLTIAIILGSFALFPACLKGIYDFFVINPKLSQAN